MEATDCRARRRSRALLVKALSAGILVGMVISLIVVGMWISAGMILIPTVYYNVQFFKGKK